MTVLLHVYLGIINHKGKLMKSQQKKMTKASIGAWIRDTFIGLSFWDFTEEIRRNLGKIFIWNARDLD